MTRSRIEGLLNAFPKLLGSADQHTFVETEAVRYVYQPLDELYIILITNKNSNILQDIDTLHLFARVVSEYCRSTEEKEIVKQRFELILVFDEVISLGFRENINLGYWIANDSQIKTISAMESNDERIQAEIEKNKEIEAREEMKRRAQLMDLKKSDGKTPGGYPSSGYSSSAGAYTNNTGSSAGFTTTSSYAPSQFNSYTPPAPKVVPGMGKGMQLGKKTVQSSLVETIQAEEGVKDAPLLPQAEPEPVVDEEGIHVIVEEKISATANRDGGLSSLEVNGSMLLKVNDESKARVTLNTHPNVDKGLWGSNSVLALKDPNRPFPVAQPLGILKWRYSSKDESALPLLVNCWPSPTQSGCDVTIEYDLQKQITLKNVSIIIPYTSVNPPTATAPEYGQYHIDRNSKTIVWQIPSINSENTSSLFEFNVETDDASNLYPIQVHFTSSQSFSDIQVQNVASVDGGSVEYSSQVSLVTDGFEIA
ncbi:Coatomer subunit delta [Terramyces sp. JEL0728]|nr:Coatomer subunit delta [Terramyces sp. JEL0728]